MQISVIGRRCALALGVLIVVQAAVAVAGHRFFRNNNVGGISIDTEGVVRQPNPEGQKMLLEELRKDLKQAPGAINRPVPLRMVSLRGIEQACADAIQNNLGQIPDEVAFLGGLQRIQYIFVYPERQDIVLAGPAEGWRVDANANVVGITTGRPVLRLDDLLVAFRQVDAARQVGISCSIDPTEEGYRNLMAVLDQQRGSGRKVNRAALEARMKQAFGPQKVTVTGVPPESHVARVLVAADYRMKRLAMGLDNSPVKGLPSYISMIKGRRNISAAVNPRWWLACNYEPLGRGPDGLSWELRGAGVKAMTEDDFVNAEGKVGQARAKNQTAQKWAEMLTANYDKLSSKDAVFGELRNLMDMCVAAAVISKNGLMQKAGCSLPLLTGSKSDLHMEVWNAPKTISPQCSLLRTRNGWLVTASGGVQVESWQVAGQTVASEQVGQLRTKSKATDSKAWYW